MLQPRLLRSSAAIDSSLASLAGSFNALTVCPRSTNCAARSAATTVFTRHASHATQGRANGPKDSAGRRLGAKKSALQYVIPGNIIFKQRGTKWHPGENVGMGKDHTIYATVAGFVRYYQDPFRYPGRKYIGVALEREGPRSVLPTPRNAITRRRLGMYASSIKHDSDGGSDAFLEAHLSADATSESSSTTTPIPATKPPPSPPVMRKATLMYREANFEIGRAAEKKGITVREYDRGDRWLAWRKREMGKKRAALARVAKATRKTKGKKSHKGQNPTRKR